MLSALRPAVPVLAFLAAAAVLTISGCSKTSGAREIPLVQEPSVANQPSPKPPPVWLEQPGVMASPGLNPMSVDRDTARTGNAPGTGNTTPAQGGNTYGTGGRPVHAFP
ncbi:MAG: hypothetical protein ACXWPM_01600 [Bdellovibrionota bacterium]